MQGIYAIRHVESGRCYVGSTVNIERRWKEHRTRIKNGTHPAKHLANAFKAYGLDSFEFVILEECCVSDESVRIERETHWMGLLQPAFNVAPVAGSVLGLKRSEEVRARMSVAQKGRESKLKGVPRSPEARAAISRGKKGKPRTREHQENLSKALKGRVSPRKGVKLSEETKQRISESKRGAAQTEEHKKAISDGLKGIPCSDEKKAKLSAAMIGRSVSPEVRAKMSASAIARRVRERNGAT